jgi:hypothetical protein
MRITTPPSNEMVSKWLIERYGNDFEPRFLNDLVISYENSINEHSEYSKKRAIKYIADNFFKLDRIYRKQETIYWLKRGWDTQIAEFKRIVRNRQWYLDKYGPIDGVIKYENKNKNISNNSGHTLDKYIDRYGSTIGTIKYDDYKKGCARNLEFFIKKYGEKDGKIKFKEFKRHIGKASKESMLVFKPLIDWLKESVDVNELYYGEDNSREFFIVNNGKTYLYDFTIKNLKIMIEFNGVKFHVNELWSENVKKEWKHPFKELTYLEAIDNDKFKLNLARDNGFSVLVIWSDLPIEENIDICKEFIKNKINENN